MGRIENFVPKKSWLNPQDFPVVTNNENQARKNMQELHDETTTYINGTLVQNANAQDAAIANLRAGGTVPNYIDIDKLGFFSVGNIFDCPAIESGKPFDIKTDASGSSEEVKYFNNVFEKAKSGNVFRVNLGYVFGGGSIEQGSQPAETWNTTVALFASTCGVSEWTSNHTYKNDPSKETGVFTNRKIYLSGFAGGHRLEILHHLGVVDGVETESFIEIKNV